MSFNKFLLQLDKITEQSPGTLKGGELLGDLYGWDSMAVIAFIALVDEKFQVQVSMKAITSCATVLDLARLVNIEPD